METRTVHDVAVPRLGFGTFQLRGAAAYEGVRAALEVGYRHVDTAQAYGNEEQVGRALADSAVDRSDVFVTTKVPRSRAGRDAVRTSHADSLRRLGLDHVDLLLIHWPSDDVPIEETISALDELRDEGKTRLIGVSNFTSDMVERALEAGPIATNQVEYHPLLDQEALLDTVRRHGITLTAYSPLAQGEVLGNDVLVEIGAAHGKTPAQVAIRWLLQQRDVLVIPRSSDPDHIASNHDVFDFELSDDEIERIQDLPKDRRQIDPGFAPEWD